MNTDILSILLKKPVFDGVGTKELTSQVQARKKAEKKLPSWFNTENIYYPAPLSIEQTSSETTAKYKSDLVSGKSLIDLTGGFGVDSFFFAKKIGVVTHCEMNIELSEIAAHNFERLKAKNIKTVAGNGIEYLKNTDRGKFDWIYIDPSRRHDQKGKVFFLKDCLPNVPEHLELLFEHSENILIKTAPLLDITAGINELKNVKDVHVVAVKNEVKELLWVLGKNHTGNIELKTTNLQTTQPNFNFSYPDSDTDTVEFTNPQKYLYEPNSAILKSGGFNALAKQLKLGKLHQHSHLYTSTKLIEFPGRVFEIKRQLPFQKKTIATALKGIKANITTRNFPESVAELRKKFKIKEGGDLYLFFTKGLTDRKLLLFCKKN